VITPAQRGGRTKEQWQLVTTATEELISRGSSPEPMAGPKARPDQRYSAAGLERNACSCSDAEKFRFLGKTLEVPETEAFKAQP
jgi:hypothetical protein